MNAGAHFRAPWGGLLTLIRTVVVTPDKPEEFVSETQRRAHSIMAAQVRG